MQDNCGIISIVQDTCERDIELLIPIIIVYIVLAFLVIYTNLTYKSKDSPILLKTVSVEHSLFLNENQFKPLGELKEWNAAIFNSPKVGNMGTSIGKLESENNIE
jgi:hypothetical protein